MKKYFIYLMLIPFFCLSQNEKVVVNYKSLTSDDKDNFGCFVYYNGKLISNTRESLYIETPRDTIVDLNYLGEYDTKGFDYKFTYYKNLDDKYVVQDRNYGLKKLIKDDNYRISWNITSNTKKILSYDCKEATGFFRGREYKAYFLESINIHSGPFKFDGLPGIILEVKSTDKSVSIVATDITFDEGDVSNPFGNIETVTWSEFINFYKQKFERVTTSKIEDSDIFMPNRYIEYLMN
jgi:GLPGLI family protein